MAEIKDPKRFYYAMRSRYMREAKQIGHKLSLAVSEEEDALQWEKYKKVMKRWQALEIPESLKREKNEASQMPTFWKPVFNDEYVELTLQLKDLYSRMNQAKTRQERVEFEDKIRALKKQRGAVTSYIDRETGEVVKQGK